MLAQVSTEFRETRLDEREKELRDLFVNEYLIDYDCEKAALRVGFNHTFAYDFGIRFLNEGYTQRKIAELESKEIDAPTIERMKSNVVRLLVKEANNRFNKATARVSALSKLVNVLGLEAPVKIDTNAIKGGVMVVPTLLDPDAWEKASKESQAKLQSTVRD